jgi:aminomethyltransferase
MNGVVTNNIRDLAPGHGVYAFVLNPQGQIQGDLFVYNHGDFLLVDTESSQSSRLREFFDHYIIMDDVEVADVSSEWAVIGVAGPKSLAVLQAAGISVPALAPRQLARVNVSGAEATLVQGDNPALSSYEIWLAPGPFASLWESLVHAGAIPAGTSAVELLRIASGVPRYGQDIRERDLPQETEQARALHFQKGCYIGQEIVERIRSRGNVHRKFTGFLLQGEMPVAGAKLQAEGKDVGEITSVASLPSGEGEKAIALGYIRREVGTPGKGLHVGKGQATVAALPFAEFFQH